MWAANGIVENLQRPTPGTKLRGREVNRNVAKTTRRDAFCASVLFDRKIARNGEIAYHDLHRPGVDRGRQSLHYGRFCDQKERMRKRHPAGWFLQHSY